MEDEPPPSSTFSLLTLLLNLLRSPSLGSTRLEDGNATDPFSLGLALTGDGGMTGFLRGDSRSRRAVDEEEEGMILGRWLCDESADPIEMASSWSSPFRFLEGTCRPSREDDDDDGGMRLDAEPALAFHESTRAGVTPFLTLNGGTFGLVVGANAPDLGLDDNDAPVGRICTSSSSDEPVRSMSGIERPPLVG